MASFSDRMDAHTLSPADEDHWYELLADARADEYIEGLPDAGEVEVFERALEDWG